MIDRSIPFYNTILKCTDYKHTEVVLPQGFSIVAYKDGYEKEWARLEHSIGDFKSPKEAEDYFISTYMKNISELKKNARFLLNENGKVIGSCIAWHDMRGSENVSSLHWLVVDEQYQGMGLGKALCLEIMNIFEADKKFPVYIHTQPWSIKAVFLYISVGFKLQKADSFSNYKNEYDKAMSVLKSMTNEEQYRLLIKAS